MTKIGIIQYPSSNCDYDTKKILEDVIGVRADLIWYKEEREPEKYDGIILPGGFSYGDYLRAGAIAAHTPISKKIKKIAKQGKPVLGICNGFQVLTELKLLPGALMTNKEPKFLCKHVHLKVESTNSCFTQEFNEGEVIKLPIAHKEGNYFLREKNLEKVNKENRALFSYCDEEGRASETHNPNGSVQNIAGVLNENRNILGMMPHPERGSEEILGTSDGRKILSGLVKEANKS